MVSRNFGIGSRNMATAGDMALRKARENKSLSFASEKRYGVDWGNFCGWAKEQGLNKMEAIERQHVIDYGREIAARVAAQELSPASAQMMVCSVNRVLQLAGARWHSISPTKECNIPERVRYRENTPATLDRQAYEAKLDAITTAGHSTRAIAVCELARELGLRSKEASMLNAQKALKEAQSSGKVTIKEGTKGGLTRQISVSAKQIAVLAKAAEAQGNQKAVMPTDHNWKEWQGGPLREVREAMGGLHELRTAYACERYEALTGHAPPCSGQTITDKALDKEARMLIAQELGHGRIDVVAEYIGRRA